MELSKIVKKAMVDKDINGVMELVEKSGVSYSDVTKILKGNGSVKLVKVKEVLDFLGLKLKVEVK